jgi:hypothetical protein
MPIALLRSEEPFHVRMFWGNASMLARHWPYSALRAWGECAAHRRVSVYGSEKLRARTSPLTVTHDRADGVPAKFAVYRIFEAANLL